MPCTIIIKNMRELKVERDDPFQHQATAALTDGGVSLGDRACTTAVHASIQIKSNQIKYIYA